MLLSWIGAWPGWGLLVSVGVVLCLAVWGRTLVVLVASTAALVSSLTATSLEPLAPGRVEARGVMVTDVLEGRFGPYALIELDAGPVLADLPPEAAASRGDVVEVEGLAGGESGTIRGERHRGVVDVGSFRVVAGPSSPIQRWGNSMRDRVIDRLTPLEGGRALLAGFLVGDTSGVDEIDQSAMRRAGLSHYTAVSGSNVALFLGLLYVVAGPIGVGPRRRAVVGLLGLPVFAAATRFEPSVVRASAMAALGLGGRLIGMAMEAWQVLAAAVTGLLLLDPTLIHNTGFQLSVAATAGVMVGARWPVAGSRVNRTLAVTVAAQAVVAPLLLIHFGLVPLLSPLANLVAAPLVAMATVLGAVGVIGPGFVGDIGAWLAGIVLGLARVASAWPQIGWPGLGIILTALLVHLRFRRWRGQLAVVAALAVVWSVLGPVRSVPDPGVVVLDVGQGDAILLSGGQGRFALVDGGPDPVILVEALQEYGVRDLDLVVLTHVHADHATGLAGLVGRVPIGLVWARTAPHETSASAELIRVLGENRVEVSEPRVGESLQLGALNVTVEGPLRTYASPNDQSVVLTVAGPGRAMLLSGDIETIAQAELGHLRADVLKVPHQGAATSDPDWLEQVGSSVAVISVGPNDFGHPADWVITTLEESGATVIRTDVAGDVVVPLG